MSRRDAPAKLLAATLCGATCACQSTAPVSSAPARPRALAVEWTGVRAIAEPAPGAATADTGPGPWVLHVGDSFTDAFFQQNLGPRFRAAGARYVVDAVTSTLTTTWARSADFDRWLSLRPALVLVTLGANEIDLPAPGQRARAIETIAGKVAASGASCVWITPPMWTHETGILQVIYEHCAPCVYFDSDALLGGGLSRAERWPDGIHPNSRGGARWAEAFWGWLGEHRDASRGPWAVVPFERRLD
jgi:lysophospholipase L1-like esterase